MKTIYHDPHQIPNLRKPTELRWVRGKSETLEVLIKDYQVAWIEPRPAHCDRGHWMVNINLPGIDHADNFPRYYMTLATAVFETEAFIKWRLWKERF